MDEKQRESAVRKLRALADRLAAGEDVGSVFYALDKDCKADVGVTFKEVEGSTAESLEDVVEAVRFEQCWRGNDPTTIEFGIVVPLMVCRLVTCEVYYEDGERQFYSLDHGMVDPETYTYPEDTVIPIEEVK